jgi:TonB family protein
MPARRTRQVRESTIWATAVAALVVHALILGAVHAFGISLVSGGMRGAPSAAQTADTEADLEASCAGNAVLGTSGRTAMCFAPWVGDVDRCLAEAQLSMWMDLSSCQDRNDPSTAITMVEPRTVERMKPIDPERLLEGMKPEAKAPPPPPPPPPPQVAAAPPPPPPPPQQQLPQQVVETVKPSEEKEPDNARFLSEYNTRVEKQTVSRGARNEPMVAKAKPEELTAKDRPRDEPSAKPPPQDRMPGRDEKAPDVPGHLSMRSPGARVASEDEQAAKVRGMMNGAAGSVVADGYVARKGDASIEQQRKERSEVARGDNGAGGGAPQVPNLKASDQVLERALGGGSVDRLDDVQSGDETALSSKRWVYANFFNRVKRQVAQNWEPIGVWRRLDPTGAVYGRKTRVTDVRVSLSPRGEVAKIVVTSPSGVVELDEEAVRAFRAAGPFPNPPDGLVQKDNLITFNFGFAIHAQRISWRVPTAM